MGEKMSDYICLVGENGAGKSTLMKVLSGVYPYGTYGGDIVYNNETVQFKSIADSESAGIAIIYQELALIPELSVYENIYFGHEIMEGKVINWNQTIVEAAKMLKKVRLNINPSTKIKDLGVGNRQLVEIAKALSKNVKLLILDEPINGLDPQGIMEVRELLLQINQEYKTSILISSHILNELSKIADTIGVIEKGSMIAEISMSEIQQSEGELETYYLNLLEEAKEHEKVDTAGA